MSQRRDGRNLLSMKAVAIGITAFCTAGVAHAYKFDIGPDWDVNLDTNLKAPFFLSKFAGAAMRRQGAGKIVSIGDWAGIRPYNNYLPYTVSKSGLIGLTRALAKALAPEVQVNCVALGPVMPPEGSSEEEIERMLAGTLVKRLGTPEDVARAVMFLCEGTDFATGSTLLLDGGRLLN